MVESYCVKYANFLSDIYIFIQQLLEFFRIFHTRIDRTKEYFDVVLNHIFVKLILWSLDHKILSSKVSMSARVRTPSREFSWELLLRPKFRQPFLDLP